MPIPPVVARHALAGLAVFAAALAPDVARAQRTQRPTQLQIERTSAPQVGARATYSTGSPDAWGFGGQLRLPIDWNLAFEPNADWFTRNGTTTWQANADLLALGRRGLMYARLGLAMWKTENVDLEYGLNAGIGADLPYFADLPVRPFVEGRWTFLDGRAPFRVQVGGNIVLGRR
jgi:hypothetical protein